MSAQTVTANQKRRKPMSAISHIINPLVMRLAGTPLLPLYGVITHRGRRSGKLFRTPVVVRPTPGGFIVPMPWGETTDWYRNIRAAGGCEIRWKGRNYQVVDPQVLRAEEAPSAFSGPMRTGMQRFGIKQVVKLSFA